MLPSTAPCKSVDPKIKNVQKLQNKLCQCQHSLPKVSLI